VMDLNVEKDESFLRRASVSMGSTRRRAASERRSCKLRLRFIAPFHFRRAKCSPCHLFVNVTFGAANLWIGKDYRLLTPFGVVEALVMARCHDGLERLDNALQPRDTLSVLTCSSFLPEWSQPGLAVMRSRNGSN
jgi:hypothetical protein